MEKMPAYYAVIPASVRYDANLSPNAKLLYGEITALCNEKGYCWATNEYFSSLYSLSKRTISALIKDLCDSGYIIAEFILDKNKKTLIRRLRMSENFHTPLQKTSTHEENFYTPHEENFAPPIVENDQYNKREMNNTTSQIFSVQKISSPPKENQTQNDNFSSEELNTQENEILTESKISDNELKKKKNKKEKSFDVRSDPYLLAKLLEQNIAANNPKFPQSEQQRQRWAKDIDLMIRRDKLQADDIAAVIDWCQKDSFWRCNILSGKKLRDKYQQLSMKMLPERR